MNMLIEHVNWEYIIDICSGFYSSFFLIMKEKERLSISIIDEVVAYVTEKLFSQSQFEKLDSFKSDRQIRSRLP